MAMMITLIALKLTIDYNAHKGIKHKYIALKNIILLTLKICIQFSLSYGTTSRTYL